MRKRKKKKNFFGKFYVCLKEIVIWISLAFLINDEGSRAVHPSVLILNAEAVYISVGYEGILSSFSFEQGFFFFSV